MKMKELLGKVDQALETNEEGHGRKRRDALKKVLKKLETKHNRLEERIKAASGGEKRKLEKKLKTVKKHQEKATKALKST
jgi:hypothetical protein